MEENGSKRKWENQETEDVVRVQKFETGTWDTFLNERLIENYDSMEDAVERGKELMDN